MRQDFRERIHRGKFLIPNAVTLANMFCGFLAIVYSTSGRFEKAAIAMGVAILLDGLDGRLARRLNATSKFGVEFDSFSDLVSFGLAPAITVYNWCFRVPADEFGVTVCFLYVLAAAGRLARFNITDSSGKNFQGLPTPGAAGLVAASVYCFPGLEPTFQVMVIATVMQLSLAYLMVSNLEFFSVKRVRFEHITSYRRILLGAAIAFLWYQPRWGGLGVAVAYVGSGPAMWFFSRERSNT